MGKKIKKIKKGSKKGVVAMLALFMLLALSAPVFAQDLIAFSGLNIEGDTLYLPSTGTFAVGIGTNIATIKDVLEIRGMVVTSVTSVDKESGNRIGLGLGVNVVKLISKVGGTWIANKIMPTIGVTALVNVNGDAHIEPALYVSIISIAY